MKVRIISAIIALAIVIPIIIIGGYPFALVIGILSVLSYKEIVDLKKSHKKIPVPIMVLGLIALVYLVLGNMDNSLLSFKTILIPLVLILLPSVFYKKDVFSTNDALYLLGVTYLLGIFYNLLIIIRNTNVYVLTYLLSVAILTDTFAYAVGCLIGKHKMAPTLSPLKSWEGAIAGLVGGTVISLIIYCNLVAPFSIKILLVTICLSVVGQIGDLFYSKIKRENEIKDFSNIMPGHGGILDRIDSLCFIVFIYIIILWTI